MKDYKVKLESTGMITQVPDSQRLFGSIVSLFAEKFGDDRATELTKAVLRKKIHFALSNILPEGYLPTPQDYLIDQISKSNSKDADTDLKKMRAKIKLRNYIEPEGLKRVLMKPTSCGTTYPYVKQQNMQQSRASIDSLRYDIPVLDNRLYSVPTVVLSKIDLVGGKEHCQLVKEYYFYLQVDDSKLCSDFLSMLRTAKEKEQTIVLGKRASQGLNLFRFTDLKEQKDQTPDSETYLNTGMLLPDRIDFDSSVMRLFTSERRPFEMIGGWSEDIPKYFISYIAQGSIIVAPQGRKQAGKSISSPFNSRNIVFGNAFLYPLV